MIYVFTENYRQFQGFLHEHHLREQQGNIGQVRYLGDAYGTLQGIREGIVLAWGTWQRRLDAEEVQAYCRYRDIPFLPVPDLRRERYLREQRARKPR